MKCPACWAEKAYIRDVRKGWKRTLMKWLLIVPMRCHHCYHEFYVSWFQTLGKQVQPRLRIAPGSQSQRATRPNHQQPMASPYAVKRIRARSTNRADAA